MIWRVLALLLAPVAAFAAPADPNWPCQQIKVAELSLAAVWSGPAIDPQQGTWQDDVAVSGLVQKLAPRREPIDRAGGLIHDFAQQAGEQKQVRLSQLLIGLFSVLGEQRDSVMAGLDRFGGRQKELADQIRQDNEKLRELQADPSPDAEAIQLQTQKVVWELEIFQDRRQALTYACEVPGKIEQRLFALAQQIQHELE
jgi:hypothetical protein